MCRKPLMRFRVVGHTAARWVCAGLESCRRRMLCCRYVGYALTTQWAGSGDKMQVIGSDQCFAK